MHDKILRHLLAGNSLTQDEAWEKFRCKQLSGVASRLKDDDWPVATVIVRDSQGRLATSYHMSETSQAFWGLPLPEEDAAGSDGATVPKAVQEPAPAAEPSPLPETPAASAAPVSPAIPTVGTLAYYLGPDGRAVLQIDGLSYGLTAFHVQFLSGTAPVIHALVEKTRAGT